MFKGNGTSVDVGLNSHIGPALWTDTAVSAGAGCEGQTGTIIIPVANVSLFFQRIEL